MDINLMNISDWITKYKEGLLTVYEELKLVCYLTSRNEFPTDNLKRLSETYIEENLIDSEGNLLTKGNDFINAYESKVVEEDVATTPKITIEVHNISNSQCTEEVNDFEKNVFSKLFSNYSNLLLTKATINDINVAVVVTRELIEAQDILRIEPILIIVNNELINQLNFKKYV